MRHILGSTCGCVLLVAAPCAAQERSPTAPAAPAPGDSDAPQPSTSTTSSGDIIVTAQRRSERLVDVPLSVTAISGAALAQSGATAIDSITKMTPGVVIDRLGAYVQPTIRGIGTSVTGPGADPNVAIYVDGIYQPSQSGNTFDLPNVEQVEVLKGPQGTLFGRNATGGAILITTRAPSFVPKADIGLSYARFDEVRASAYGSTGLTSTIAGDVAVYFRRSQGWIHDLRTGADRNRQSSFDARSKLLWQPSSAVRFTLSGVYNRTSDPTGLAGAVINGNSAGRSQPNSGPIATDRGDLSHNLAPMLKVKVAQVALNGSIELGPGTLASITAYRHETGHIESDLEGSYAPTLEATYDQFFKNFSQELTLTSRQSGPFKWVMGTFYFFERSGQPNFLFNRVPFLNSQITTHAISGFADGTYTLGSLSVIAGIRYSTEKKRFQIGRGFGPYTVDTGQRFSKWTPRVGLRYAIDPHSNIYATYSQGFKSGTYNNAAFVTLPVQQEGVDAYEVGFKTARSGISFNAAGFYYKYDDIQVTAFDYDVGTSRLFNAASATIYGAEFDGSVRFSDAFDVRAAAAYTHGVYDSFPGAPSFQPRPPGNTGNISTVIDASGAQMIRAPRLTVSGTAAFHAPAFGGVLTVSASPYWSSKINYSFDERISQPAYFTMDGNIAWARDRWRLSIFAQNIFDKHYATFRTASSSRDSILYAQPATVGIAARWSY